MNANLEQYSNYKILTEEKLIVEYYYGEVTEDVIIDMKMRIAGNKDYNAGFNAILDFRDSVFNISSEGMRKITEFIDNNMKIVSDRKIGLLTHTPNHVVVTMLFTNQELPMMYHIFSTLRVTCSWISSTTGLTTLKPENDDLFKLVVKVIDKLRI